MTAGLRHAGRTTSGGLLCLLTLTLVATGVSAATGAPHAWQPERVTYAVAEDANVPVTMADGVVLRADVYYPVDPVSASRAPGPFPVVLTQTPYGKSAGLALTGGSLEGPFPYLVQRGYIDVVVDVRGTGASQGSFGFFGPAQVADGVTLVGWAAKLRGSSGKVGLYGESYLGVNQLLTAGAVGPGSPLKAIFPVVASNDLYRDITFFGGVPDTEFISFYAALTGGLALTNPPAEGAQSGAPSPDLAALEAAHAASWTAFWSNLAKSYETGGTLDYPAPYWEPRSPAGILENIAHNGVPAYLVGGWHDVFQRGELLNYVGLQNAFFGRPVEAPMRAGQPVTGNYQLLMGPWYHATAGAGVDLQLLELQWFDQWLKGEDTGITHTDNPLHLSLLGSSAYRDAAIYPFPDATPTTFYLSGGPSGAQAPSTNDGALVTARPQASQGGDSVVFTDVTSPCNVGSDQWGAGFAALGSQTAGTQNPCDLDDRTIQAGPGALTYTTVPFDGDRVVAGPIAATLYVTSSRPDAFIEATLEDVAPSGRSTPLTTGGLLGSMRALDAARSWLVGGDPILPFHSYAQASQVAMATGVVTRLDIEVFPTFARIPSGDRLRLTLTTSDSPHLVFTPSQLSNLSGGVYGVERNAESASFVRVPLEHAPGATLPPPTASAGGKSGNAAIGSASPNTASDPGAPSLLSALAAAAALTGARLRRRRRLRCRRV